MKRSRQWIGIQALLAAIVVSMSIYLEYYIGLSPCTLCMMQRVIWGGVLCVLALEFWVYRLIWLRLGLILLGAVVALRHIWLQHQVKEVYGSCLPGSTSQWMRWFDFLKGSASCRELHGVWMGLSLPTWSLLMYVTFLILLGLELYSKDKLACENSNHFTPQ